MQYQKKPEMIFFDVGGTLFDDGRFDPVAGFEGLRVSAVNPEITCAEALASVWDEYLDEVGKITSESGINLDIPLSAIIKYATMQSGLLFEISAAEQEELFDRFNSSRNVIDGVHELLSELTESDIRSAVISNNMMSGESLTLAINRWIPENKFEFCLTSADLLFTKPSEKIFTAAANYAHISPADCWYCGDGRIPDVDGAQNAGMAPVLLDLKSDIPYEFREDGGRGRYLAVNSWNALRQYLFELK